MRLGVSAVALAFLAAACGSPSTTASTVAVTVVESDPTSTTTTQPPLPEEGAVQTVAEIEGEWRIVLGTLDGTLFADATTGGFVILFWPDAVSYPDNCNEATARLTIADGSFTLGDTYITDVGCSEASMESVAFVEAFNRAHRIAIEGEDLVLTGEETELRFVRLVAPTGLGELPLTSAGNELTFDIPEGRSPASHYLIVGSPERLGRTTYWALTTATDDTEASAVRWQEADVQPGSPADPGPGPVTVVMPDDIPANDWALCSPFWEPDPYCFALSVRLPSAPWFVTAGLSGVTLYNANGTSEQLTEEPTAIAFYIEERLVVQLIDQMDQIRIDDLEPITIPDGGRLVDVATVDEHLHGLVVGPAGSVFIDLETGEVAATGPPAVRGVIAGDTIVLQSGAGLITAVGSVTGEVLWDRSAEPDTLVSPERPDILRLNTLRVLQADAGPETYYQFVATELIEVRSGEVIEFFEWEVAIPLEGDNIKEPCGLPAYDGKLLLCPQPDGRIVSLEVSGGESRTVADKAISATFAQS